MLSNEDVFIHTWSFLPLHFHWQQNILGYGAHTLCFCAHRDVSLLASLFQTVHQIPDSLWHWGPRQHSVYIWELPGTKFSFSYLQRQRSFCHKALPEASEFLLITRMYIINYHQRLSSIKLQTPVKLLFLQPFLSKLAQNPFVTSTLPLM